MKNFKKIDGLPVLDLHTELSNLLDQGKIDFFSSQISLNTTINNLDNYKIGCGSLFYDWENSTEILKSDGTVEIVPKKYETPLVEEDFTILCSQFKDTLFETVYQEIAKTYKIGRVRIMKMNSKYCMSWHTDTSPRLHFPIKTQTGNFMVIDDEFMHIPKDEWWLTNTEKPHTALNASNEGRIHLVATILEKWK